MRLIESERLYVRHFTMHDLDNFFRLNGDEEIMRYIRAPKSYEETKAFLQDVITWYSVKPVNLRMALLEKETGIFVGSFAIIPVSGSSDIQLGYSLLKEYWGRGYATEITKAALRYAFDVLGLDSIAGVTEKLNIPSQLVLSKAGFVLEKEYEENGKSLLYYRCTKRE